MSGYEQYVDKEAMDLHDAFGVSEETLIDYCNMATNIMKSKSADSSAEFIHQCMKIPETQEEALLMMFVVAGAITAPDQIFK